ncbi:hypothetical protein Tsubulata_013839 [Turnera subulata]|uniref:Uncharacterized protein n=1 Tax=Turnera subulata TaxID=218843 RepID=A0A9Q0G5Q0_9ROSI|nr:hypothetical protein Tsubulata_013839 [Turnera subulata]
MRVRSRQPCFSRSDIPSSSGWFVWSQFAGTEMDILGTWDSRVEKYPNDCIQRCFSPVKRVEKAKSGKPVTQLNTSSMIVETEKRIKLKTPDELLDVLKGSCFIREFILGVYDEEATASINQNLSDISMLLDPRSRDASQRYHPHQYTNGTMCDLTNHPRETENVPRGETGVAHH